MSSSHLLRKLNAIGNHGDSESRDAVADQRILEMSQAMSTMAGEKIIDRFENQGDQIKMTELQKVYTASTTQVAAERRWVQGFGSGENMTGDAASSCQLRRWR